MDRFALIIEALPPGQQQLRRVAEDLCREYQALAEENAELERQRAAPEQRIRSAPQNLAEDRQDRSETPAQTLRRDVRSLRQPLHCAVVDVANCEIRLQLQL